MSRSINGKSDSGTPNSDMIMYSGWFTATCWTESHLGPMAAIASASRMSPSPNLVMDAVNARYHVVLPRDAVTRIPAEYGEAIIDNTMSLLATITTTDDLLQIWAPS